MWGLAGGMLAGCMCRKLQQRNPGRSTFHFGPLILFYLPQARPEHRQGGAGMPQPARHRKQAQLVDLTLLVA